MASSFSSIELDMKSTGLAVQAWLFLMTLLPLSSPVGSVSSEEDLIVRLEIAVESREGTVIDSSWPVRVQPGDRVEFTLRVTTGDRVQTLVDVEDPGALVEVRPADGEGDPIRLDSHRVSQGVYVAMHRFDDPGEFLVVTQPDVQDRASLHLQDTDRVEFIVGGSPPLAPKRGVEFLDGAISLVLVALVATLVLVATRGRSKRTNDKPRPVTHDSWWNAP